ncbi:MAG: hypothetical protein M1812_005835 [Candelaria pacifica]|nr:MAG: hypothetical protein M1812_005835 [Candelaria pacifica]
MSRWMDPQQPKEPTEKQREGIRREPEIRWLCRYRDHMFVAIRLEHGSVKNAKATGEPVYNEYQAVKRAAENTFRARERALLKQVQAEYDAAAPVNDIHEQLNGPAELFDRPLSGPGAARHAFIERTCIAEAFFDHPSAFTADDSLARRIGIIQDLALLCTFREIRTSAVCRKRRSRVESILDQIEDPFASDFSQSETSKGDLFPLQCHPFQCIFCLGDRSLIVEDRRRIYAGKNSAKQHVYRCHLTKFQPDELISCPYPHPACAEVVLRGIMHLKNHVATVHNSYL